MPSIEEFYENIDRYERGELTIDELEAKYRWPPERKDGWRGETLCAPSGYRPVAVVFMRNDGKSCEDTFVYRNNLSGVEGVAATVPEALDAMRVNTLAAAKELPSTPAVE